jgi:hypothetical protein
MTNQLTVLELSLDYPSELSSIRKLGGVPSQLKLNCAKGLDYATTSGVVVVAGYGGNTLTAVDVTLPFSPQIIGSIRSNAFLRGAWGVAHDASRLRCFVTGSESNTVVNVNMTNFYSPHITSWKSSDSKLQGARGIAYSADLDVVFVAVYSPSSSMDNGLMVLDVSNNKFENETSIELASGACGATAVALDPANNYVFVACHDDSSIYYVDVGEVDGVPSEWSSVVSRELLKTADTTYNFLNGIMDIVYDKFNSRLYASAKDASAVSVIDAPKSISSRLFGATIATTTIADSSNLQGAYGLTFQTNFGNDYPGLTVLVVGCFDGNMATLVHVKDTVAN